MAELKGSLGGIGLPSIAKLVGDLRQSGNLVLTRSGSRGVLGFYDGRLVAATFDDDLGGLKALAACTRELADAEFVFTEGAVAGERTLDLGGAELQDVLSRLKLGDVSVESLEAPPVKVDQPAEPESCPFLGFVDDATHHYSRPTALHRCHATGAPALVSNFEQRDLCLSGRHPTCPRFGNALNSTAVSPPPAAAAVEVAAPAPAPLPGGVPARVAARMEAASQMRPSMAVPASAEAAPTPPMEGDDEPAVLQTAGEEGRWRRRPLLIALAGALGLIVLVGALLLAVPALRGGSAPKPSDVAVQAQPGATVASRPTTGPAVAAKPVAAASPVPQTGTVPPRPVPTPVPGLAGSAPARSASASALPSVVPVTGRLPVDLTFTAGPSQGWPDNPPFAVWSDGAYRLKAAQATSFVAVAAPIETPLTDVVVSATFRKTGGGPGGGYGLLVRNQSPAPLNGVNQNLAAYVMEAGDRGEFGIWRRDGDRWIDLVSWTRSDSVRVGGSPNNLEARAVGNRLTFSVNGAQLASVQDDTLAAGGVGVFVGGDYNEVALDRFAAQAPD